jgi:hypothetical protein
VSERVGRVVKEYDATDGFSLFLFLALRVVVHVVVQVVVVHVVVQVVVVHVVVQVVVVHVVVQVVVVHVVVRVVVVGVAVQQCALNNRSDNMPNSSPANDMNVPWRNRLKLGSYVLVVAGIYYSVFWMPFNNIHDEHVYSDVCLNTRHPRTSMDMVVVVVWFNMSCGGHNKQLRRWHDRQLRRLRGLPAEPPPPDTNNK